MLPIFEWNPRIGDTGDDNFDLPHGTKMDGSYVVDKEQALLGNGSTGYPVPPTLPSVNAGRSLNQIIAAVNYKSDYLDTNIIAAPPDPVNYISAPNSIRRLVGWGGIATRIDLIRAIEGYAAFPFTAIAVGDMARAWQLAERRKALALIGTGRATYGSAEYYVIPGFPLLGLYAAGDGSVNTVGGGFGIGLGSGVSEAGRAIHFRLLPWMMNWLSASIEIVVTASSGSFTGELWLSNSDDKFYGSGGSFLAGCDNLIGTWSANGTYTFDLTPYFSILNVVGNEFASFVFTTTEQRTAGARPGTYKADATLIRDYGA